MSTPIFITVPTKYIPINVAPTVVAKPSATTTTTTTAVKPLAKRPASVAPSSMVSDDESSSMDEFIVRGKKRRLDHLTWEEKIQRKKLKNRVAAQTSRDRKKAKMEEMEKTIHEQSEQIVQLQNRCSALDTEKSAIYGKYLDLERRFEDLQQRLLAQERKVKEEPQEDDVVVGGSVGCVTAGRQTGSAASPRCPQQQGLYKCGPAETQTTLPPTANDPRLAALWRIIAICLLYRTCSKISTCPSSRSLPKPYSQVSAQTWKTLIAQAARLMPKASAPASACLDQWWGPQQNSWNPTPTGNRLILTTHNYSKSPFYELSEQPAEPPKQEREEHDVRSVVPSSDPLPTHQQQPAVMLPNSDTLYGTYDNETNCITIVLASDEEVSETTITTTCMDGSEDGVAEASSEELILLEPMEQTAEKTAPATAAPLPAEPYTPLAPITIRPPSPLQDLLSPIAHHPLKSPGGLSSVSDAGYESLGSPVPSTIASELMPTDPSMMSLDYALSDDFSEFWNLDPLFPILE
uniref:X-box-binding protein 1 n=1 Tax=Anopheles stephensi TaxID=30069 RepID=A0A182YA77_ANOST